MFQIRKLVGLSVILLGWSLASCQSSKNLSLDPKERLRDYISLSFAVSNLADRDRLAEFLGGQAKTRLLAWSDEQFLQAFVDQKRQFIKLLVKEIEKRTESQIAVTYELTYMNQKEGKDAKVTNKKLAQMELRDGKWVIVEVQNLKELIEYKNEMSLP